MFDIACALKFWGGPGGSRYICQVEILANLKDD